jgi:hypothetical protein
VSCESIETARAVQDAITEYVNDAPAWLEDGLSIEDVELSED